MVVFTKRLNGLSLIELLMALVLSSSLFIIVTTILTTSHKAELNLFSNYQSVDAFMKMSGILKNDCVVTKKSIQLIRRLSTVIGNDHSIIFQLKNGIQLENKFIKFTYLSEDIAYLNHDMNSHDSFLVNKNSFKKGDLIMLYDDKDMQPGRIKSVLTKNGSQMIILEDRVDIKKNKGASVAKIYQHTFDFQKNSISIVENSMHKAVLTNEVELTELFYLLNNNGHFNINKFEGVIPPGRRPAGFIIKWRARKNNSPLANFWCLMS